MNQAEFQNWLEYHTAAYPSIAKWLAESPATVHHWQRVLDDVKLEDAKQATDEMLRGDLEEPRGYGEHPRRIRQRALEIAAQRQADEAYLRQPSYDDSCDLCHGTGIVTIIHPDLVRQWRQGIPLEKSKLVDCAVACSCPLGERWTELHGQGGKVLRLPVYTPGVHYRCGEYLLPANAPACYERAMSGQEAP